MESSFVEKRMPSDPVVIETDSPRCHAWVWVWRNLWRRMLPRGLILFPFQHYPTLAYFWNAGAGASNRWIYLSWMVTAALVGLSAAEAIAPEVLAGAGFGPYAIAHLRIAALPVYMLLAALAVAARCRWWRAGGRLDEMLVTQLDGRDILPLLWTPAATKIMGIYGAGFFIHLVLSGQWELWARHGATVWFRSLGPPHVLLGTLEFLLGLLLMRAAVFCALFGAVKSTSSAGITGQSLYRAFQYILLGVAGSSAYLLAVFAAAFLAWALSFSTLWWLASIVFCLAAMSLLRHLTIDTIEDYQEFSHDWRKMLMGGR